MVPFRIQIPGELFLRHTLKINANTKKGSVYTKGFKSYNRQISTKTVG